MSESFLETLARRISQARKAAGLTQAELARRIGTDQSHISRLERAHKRVGIEHLAQIAGALNVSVAYLFGERDVGFGGAARDLKFDTRDPLANDVMEIVLAWMQLSEAKRSLVRSLISTLRDTDDLDVQVE